MGEWGEEGVKLSLSKTDDVGGSFFSKLLEVELSSSTKGASTVGTGVSGDGEQMTYGLGSMGVGSRVSSSTRVMPALADKYWGDWGT